MCIDKIEKGDTARWLSDTNKGLLYSVYKNANEEKGKVIIPLVMANKVKQKEG